MAEEPTMKELTDAMCQLKMGKAGSRTGILPEMVKRLSVKYRRIEKSTPIPDLNSMARAVEAVLTDWHDVAIASANCEESDLTICDIGGV